MTLVLDDLPTRVIALYVEHVRPLLNPQNDYLLLTRNGTQYKKHGNAMCKLVYQETGKYIHPTRYRQIIETESAKKLSLEDKKKYQFISKAQFSSSTNLLSEEHFKACCSRRTDFYEETSWRFP